MKIKAWMIYLCGLGTVLGIGLLIADPTLAGALVGEYVFYGGIILLSYYLTKWFVFRNKQSKIKKINNTNHY